MVEVLATGGLDCLCLDAEHAPFDRQAIDLCLMAARAGGLPALVRPATGTAPHILNVLDCGADGVLVPHIRSAQEAVALARLAHYGSGGEAMRGRRALPIMALSPSPITSRPVRRVPPSSRRSRTPRRSMKSMRSQRWKGSTRCSSVGST